MTRRALWFATAYTIVIIVHEGAHAITAYDFGLETTLFNFWVNIDPANQATIGQRAAYPSPARYQVSSSESSPGSRIAVSTGLRQRYRCCIWPRTASATSSAT
jgi:hypothetical protein